MLITAIPDNGHSYTARRTQYDRLSQQQQNFLLWFTKLSVSHTTRL